MDDSKICLQLAEQSYFSSREARGLGARCIETAVLDGPQAMLHEKWLEAGVLSLDAVSVGRVNAGPFIEFRLEVCQIDEIGEVLDVAHAGGIEAPRIPSI
jgi:hypothetical protein